MKKKSIYVDLFKEQGYDVRKLAAFVLGPFEPEEATKKLTILSEMGYSAFCIDPQSSRSPTDVVAIKFLARRDETDEEATARITKERAVRKRERENEQEGLKKLAEDYGSSSRVRKPVAIES